MPRWEQGARERLEQAALALFLERGFAETTVADIAARAGLTTRTFFRHFGDKREVLFGGETILPAFVRGLMLEAPPEWSPAELIAHSLRATFRQFFEGRKTAIRQRQQVIQADAGLQERDLRKLEVLATTVREGFLVRGVDELTAAVAAQLAVSVFKVSVERWLAQPGDESMARTLDEVLHELGGLARELSAATQAI